MKKVFFFEKKKQKTFIHCFVLESANIRHVF